MWVPWPYTMVAAVVLVAAAWLVRPRSRLGTAIRPFALAIWRARSGSHQTW